MHHRTQIFYSHFKHNSSEYGCSHGFCSECSSLEHCSFCEKSVCSQCTGQGKLGRCDREDCNKMFCLNRVCDEGAHHDIVYCSDCNISFCNEGCFLKDFKECGGNKDYCRCCYKEVSAALLEEIKRLSI